MPAVLSYSNAFPGIPVPNHLSGQSHPQNYRYPGAVQPQSTSPTVLSYTSAFPGLPDPQHVSGNTKVQNYIFSGALQPVFVAAGSGFQFHYLPFLATTGQLKSF